MPFISNTNEDLQEMLQTIGVNSFDDLVSNIPEEVRLKQDLNLPPKLSEFEVIKLLKSYSDMNKGAGSYTCFMGGGSYDHFIPTIVNSVLEKPEFKTAYTPYQAEVSQGTLQAMYEFQSMITSLTDMDVSNASMYDGATALAEACMLAFNHNKKTEFLIAGTINPHYRQVVDTVCQGKNLVFNPMVSKDGSCDLDALKANINDKTSAVIVQHPNAYGFLENVAEIEKICHSQKCLFIVVFDPISLGVLMPPGKYNADIAVAEGQSLGIPMNYGGPYLGLFTTKKDFVRKIPGRLSGVTQDADGKRGFVLTLQTREQQIKREKATSNICSNQGLMMLAATVYLTSIGKQGIKEIAEQCLQKSHYLAKRIQAISGFSLVSDKPFFKEFLVNTPVEPSKILEAAEKEGILAGIDTTKLAGCQDGLLIAVTEKRTKEEMDQLVDIMSKFAK